MPPLEWDEAYSLGIEEIDAQHRTLIRRLRRLGEAIGAERPVETGKELRYLRQLVCEHFEDEERWMEEAGYPGCAEHERSHRAAEALLDQARRLLAETGLSLRFVSVVEEAARWLDEHLRTDDLKLGRFRAARENLRQLASGQLATERLAPVAAAGVAPSRWAAAGKR
ncbi:MAG: hemerythrin domain-containing protein [Anaeromyxobacter sp.]